MRIGGGLNAWELRAIEWATIQIWNQFAVPLPLALYDSSLRALLTQCYEQPSLDDILDGWPGLEQHAIASP